MFVANRYELGEELGAGGLGIVYGASDTMTGETVAVKQLREEYTDAAPEMVAKFAVESAQVKHLNHPNIMQVHEVIEQEGVYYVIMEYVRGDTLKHQIAEGGLPLAHILDITIPVADALARLHQIGLLHGNVKPGNIMIRSDGTPCLMEILAQIKLSKAARDAGYSTGTKEYLSPETLRAKPDDAARDIWALGITLFEMLTGNQPFAGDTPPKLFQAILTEPTPEIEHLRPDIPSSLAHMLYLMLEKDPAARPESASLICDRLQALR